MDMGEQSNISLIMVKHYKEDLNHALVIGLYLINPWSMSNHYSFKLRPIMEEARGPWIQCVSFRFGIFCPNKYHNDIVIFYFIYSKQGEFICCPYRLHFQFIVYTQAKNLAETDEIKKQLMKKHVQVFKMVSSDQLPWPG